MPTSSRLSRALAAAAGALGLGRWLLRRSLPPGDDTLAVPGCRRPIEIRIDRHGVPHISAETDADALFGQGYCHARDRLWQMELNRRFACGELAELFGPRAVDTDRILRRLGFRHAAEQEASQLDAETRELLTSYTAGINAYLNQHRLPVEFLVLRRQPRRWAVQDTLAFARYMGWSMTFNWETELIRWRLANALGEERAAGLGPRPEPEANAFLSGLGGGASNSWVVSGARSVTGRPLLASDPHLRPRMPAVFYVAHVRGDRLDVIGATLPGAPGVLLGHNQRVAWGITVAGTDGQDFFVEKADARNPRRFAFGNEWYDAEVRREVIAVRGRAQPVIEEVVVTRHGPLLNGLLDIPAEPPLALRSITDDAPGQARAILRLNRATDAAEFRAALAEWTSPPLNFTYADTSGSIGYQLAGRVPRRAQGDGTAPVPGWDGRHEWVGVVPFEEMPAITNPPEGLWSSANNRPELPCKHLLTRDWIDDSRHQRILELLRSRPTHSLADFQDMQRDVVSLPARDIARRLTGGARVGTHPGPLGYLIGWEGELTTDSIAAAIYEVFHRKLLEHTHGDLPAPLLDHILGKGISEVMPLVSAFHVRASSFLREHLDELLATDRGPLVQKALESTFSWLSERLGPDPNGWQWGRLHQISFDHVLGLASPALDRLLRLSRGPVPVGGDQDTLAQTGVDPWHPYAAATFTVSYRQLLDVGNWDDGLFILPTGQSGHPGSPHYDDMLEQWRRGECRPLLYSRAAVEAATEATVSLRPDGAAL